MRTIINSSLVLIFLLVVFFLNSPASACHCYATGPTISEAFQQSDVVFIGEAVKAELVSKNDPDLDGKITDIKFTFLVQRNFKGADTKDNIAIKTGIGGGDCGFPFRVGFIYLVYGSLQEGEIHTNVCKRTTLIGGHYSPNFIDDKAKDEVDKLEELKHQGRAN